MEWVIYQEARLSGIGFGLPASWINSIHGIGRRIKILVQGRGIRSSALRRISGQESPGRGIEVPRPQVVEAQFRVVLLAAAQIHVRRRTGCVDFVAPSVVIVSVGDGAGRVG